MRKYIKNEVLQALEGLQQAEKQIRMILSLNNENMLQKILEQYQNVAIRIGEIIEGTEGTGTEAVILLEQLCEAIYQIYIDRELAIGEFSEALDKVIRAVRVIPIQKEIVFLPYKAAMWDSLESIWREVKDNQECVAFVVPIPYYDKNPDGTLGAMHYEGNLYPEDVPVTSWKEYDIKKNRPDEIYIHNPYDSDNFVTTVHPAFYSNVLKEYTDRLVYVPYFVGINNVVKDHLCVAPGILFSDKVYVESEEIKQIYIKNLRKFEKENHCTGVFGDFNKKLEVRKSPKYEKVELIKKENIELPPEWEKMIVSPDGSIKKVILYNVTLESLLSQSDVVLDKISSVLEFFRNNKQVVLLWRPHPLYEATMQSMRPGLLGNFREIVKQYQAEAWGIYDDTPDLNRAIALADAYYGDSSSLISLFQRVGKPIMIQNYKIIKKN